jgi:imidazolonepropionase-like amidohydrolase
MPGLVDLRTRAGLPDNPTEESKEVIPSLSPLDLADPTAIDWLRALMGGVTTAALVPGDRAVVGGTVAVVKTDRSLPHPVRVLRRTAALKAALGREPTWDNRPVRSGPPRNFYYRRPNDRMGVMATLRAAFRAGEGEIGRALGGGLPVWFTARQELDLRAAVRLGREFGLRVVLLDAAEGYKVAGQLAEAGTPVILGPFYNWPREAFEWREGRDLRWNNAGILHAAGVEVALSSGGDRPDSLREAAVMAHRYGLPREAALAAVTGTPARLLGVANRVGDLAPGRDADLVVLSGDPLEAATRVEAVVVEGRVVWAREDWAPARPFREGGEE